MFTQHNIFRLYHHDMNSYILEHEASYSDSNNTLYNTKDTNIIRIDNSFLAELDQFYSASKSPFGLDILTEDYIGAVVKLIDLKKIYELTQEKHHGMFIDISNVIIKIIVAYKIKSILKSRCEKLGIKKYEHKYFYYLDRADEVLYMFIMVRRRDINYDHVYFWIYRCDVRRWEKDCILVADLEISDKMFYHKGFSIKEGLTNLIAINIHFHYIVTHLMRVENLYLNPLRSLYIHKSEIMITNDNRCLRIVDNMYNKAAVLRYLSKVPKGRWISTRYYVFHDNIVLFENEVTKKDGDIFEFHYPLVFLDLALVKAIKIERPKYR